MKKLFLALLCSLYSAFSLAALNAPVVRAEDVVGCWERIHFSEKAQKEINEIEPWPLPYQWFCFEPDGALYTLGTSTYSKLTSESLHEAFKVLPKDITYTILHPGIIRTEQKSVGQTLVWGANFMGNTALFDGKVLEKGTLFMSLFNREKQKNVYYRYLKRVDTQGGADTAQPSRDAPAYVTAAATPLPPRPDYVTAWPKQVPVEKPDPVLGDKPYLEIWSYSKEFAKRFKGFPVEGADTDFSPGAYAFVFRAYKENLWSKLSPAYPEQYRCEYDFYFNSSIRIPLSEKPTWVYEYRYPKGVTESYVRLDPVHESDRQALRIAKPAPFDTRLRAVLLADGPLDGRFATHRVAYYPDLAPELAMARLTTLFNCEALAPKAPATHFWLSSFGHRPYKEGPLSTAMHGSHIRGMKGAFDPGPDPMKDGYFRMPEAFYRTVLPKVTLVKVLNDCVRYHHAYTLPNKGSPESWAKLFSACKEIEERGVIYSFPFSNVVEGLHELGF